MTISRLRGLFPRRAFVIAALAFLWAFAASDSHPASLTRAAHAATKRQAEGEKQEHDLSALRVFNRVVLLIKDNYVDPNRIEPRKMLVAALDGVERQAAEVMVDGDEKSPSLTVTVGKVSKTFDVSGVDTFWRMSFALKEIFDFIDKNLTNREETQEIEYAAANGMLSTLDPHSVLLKPEYFKEMKLQTKGEFGGLGFVIQMKEGTLTVVKVLKNTPAQKMGIKSKDQILRIEDESTINMDLNEAVSKLRGKPGTDINITVLRKGWPASKVLKVTRAIINVESVVSKLLDNDVGYIKLKAFQGNTARDMHAELKRLKAQAAGKGGKLKGLVLDLRGNPGGLLEQAIQVSDAFLGDGTIVTTVGYSDKLREVKKAQVDDDDVNLPLVVIVNPGSASASEIVAGALKNLDRAVVIGRPTFGKGSVQVLYDFPDDSALKLTIAKYLTPGDVSIQEVGIVPDIELVPSRVTKDRVDVFAPKKQVGEADLDKHFGNPDSDTVATKREEVVRREKPLEELRYLADELKKKGDPKEKSERDDLEVEDLEGEDPDTEEIVEDYPIRFARDMLVAAPVSRRTEALKLTKTFVDQKRKQEEERINAAIEKVGVDWKLGEAKGEPKLVAEMTPAPTENTVAGEDLTWTVTAKNTGTAPFQRLRAYSKSENPYFDRREFLFGTVPPGEKKSWTVKVKVPKDMVSRRDEVKLLFFDERGAQLEELNSELSIVELPRPTFAYSWQIVDRCERCNGDGTAQRGETVEMAVQVKNVGAGKAFDAVAVLKNKADEFISLNKGRFKLGEVEPGETELAMFEFEVKPEFKPENADLQLMVGDEPTDEYITETLKVSVPNTLVSAEKSAVIVRALDEVQVRAAALETAPVIGRARKGSAFTTQAKLGDYYRVQLGDRFGFVAAAQVREGRGEAGEPPIEMVEMRREPQIEVTLEGKGGVVTDKERFTLSGRAYDEHQLRDLYIFVNEQKVFFKSSADEGGKSIRFTAELPLKVGINSVLIVAREEPEFLARKILLIRRTGTTELAQKPVVGPKTNVPKVTP